MVNNSDALISIIPQPGKIELRDGFFAVKNTIIIYTNSHVIEIAEYLKQLLASLLGLDVKIKDFEQGNIDQKAIILKMISDEKLIQPEGYILEICPNEIVITGSAHEGIFYGIHTLLQLLPLEIQAGSEKNLEWSVPCVRIEDYPRFSWRGFMLDESRHFFGKQVVKKILDIMCSLKFNKFHWHLTDDQGWRIEIKKYPRLIEIGSKRKGTIKNRKSLDGIPISGYYTQEDLKEIVQYASERYITIIPEIDVPGHVLSLLASYPELSCTGGPFEVSTHFGVFNDVLCIGKEKVFEVVQNILEEVMQIFPSKIIHTGGDEVPRERWKNCPDCQARIKKAGLISEDELQVYFTNRISDFLLSKGRTLMGWNEILDKKLTSNAICQYWYNDFNQVLDQAKNGRDVVISEMQAVYLNYPYLEIPLRKTYEYEPIPKSFNKEDQEHILGLEACLWSEYVKDEKRLEWLIFPRLIALAESTWSPSEHKDYNSFLSRLDSYLNKLKIMQINFASKEEVIE